MKKVLLLSNKIMHYRVSVYNYFHTRFAEHGWEFIVRSNEIQKENPHPLRFDFRSLPFALYNYTKEIKQQNPDVVIIFLHLKDAIIWPLTHWLKFHSIPFIFWTKGINLDANNNTLSYLFYRYMHTLSDRLILYSNQESRHIAKRHQKKIFVANNTINFSDFPDILESKRQIKRSLNIPFEKVVLSVGRMNIDRQRKKVDHLIDVFRDINIEGMGLVIVGSGLSSELRNRMNKRNTLYLGEIYDPEHLQISRIFKMADVFCLPGHVGLGLNQAFYWGLPVITEDDGRQPPEIHYLVNGRNGFIVPNNDLDCLKEKLVYLLTNDGTRLEFSTNARADILTHASIEGMFTGFKNCVESCVNSK